MSEVVVVYTQMQLFLLSAAAPPPLSDCAVCLSVCLFGLLQNLAHSSTVEEKPGLPAWVK